MRLLTFTMDGSPPRIGALAGPQADADVVDLSGPIAELGVDRMEQVVAMDGPVWARLGEFLASAGLPHHPLESVTLLPPVTAPLQMPFVRTNYPSPDGVRPDLERPSFFSKLPSTLLGHGADLVLPRLSSQVDWEAEVVLIIGRRAAHVPLDEAMDYVAGFSITNDITARDIQATGEQTLAKNFRTFAPLGPWLVTGDEVPDPADLIIRQWVNDQLFQEGSTGDMVFGIPEIVSFLSSVTDLHPGDVVATGSPAGLGLHQDPPVFLEPGDRLRVEVDGLGVLANQVVGPAN
jgi:2-keto-4-pentenoate hydratase/2-oxohepta-3-ene-1,7-dioic acid hydratase in catechol pathway